MDRPEFSSCSQYSPGAVVTVQATEKLPSLNAYPLGLERQRGRRVFPFQNTDSRIGVTSTCNGLRAFPACSS